MEHTYEQEHFMSIADVSVHIMQLTPVINVTAGICIGVQYHYQGII